MNDTTAYLMSRVENCSSRLVGDETAVAGGVADSKPIVEDTLP